MNVYRYQLTQRPASPETTPNGPGIRFTEENTPTFASRQYGSVYYDAPLSIEDMIHYSLLPVTEMLALNGRSFIRPYRNDESIHYHLATTEESMFVKAKMGDIEQERYENVFEVLQYIRSEAWKPNN